jgi:hypothetical protein
VEYFNFPEFFERCRFNWYYSFNFFYSNKLSLFVSAKCNYYNDGNIQQQLWKTNLLEDLIQISSQLKKEELSFYPGQFLYAESDGNYVVFYLNRNNLIKKEIIRNSINNIEQQLSDIPYF